MDKQTYDTLYNTTLDNITEDVFNFFEKLLEISKAKKLFLFPIIASVIATPFCIASPFAFIIFGGIISLLCMPCVLNIKDSKEELKKLGISKEEYKQLKKNGKLKSIKKMVKQCNQNPEIFKQNIEKIEKNKQLAEEQKFKFKQPTDIEIQQLVDDAYSQAISNIEQQQER